MDRIRIDKLVCYGYHGALPEENLLGQRYETTIDIEMDFQAATEADDVAKTLDYREAVALAEEVLTGPPCKLVETLAERIARKILYAAPTIQAVTVEVAKPKPPVPYDLAAIRATVHRTR